MPEDVAAERSRGVRRRAGRGATVAEHERRGGRAVARPRRPSARRHRVDAGPGATAGRSASSRCSSASWSSRRSSGPSYGAPEIQSLAISALPIAFAAVAQAIVVISGGIDLSVGSMMALTSVTAAVLMQDQGDEFGVAVVVGVLLMGARWSVPSTARSSSSRECPTSSSRSRCRSSGPAPRCSSSNTPGGGAAHVAHGPHHRLARQRMGAAGAGRARRDRGVVWIPLRRSTLGLSLYAIGSDRLAAFRSGVSVGRTKIIAYALTGLFCGARWPGADRQHRRRHAGARVRTRSRAWPRSSSAGSAWPAAAAASLGPIIAVFILAARPDGPDLHRRQPELVDGRPGRRSSSAWCMFGSIVAMRQGPRMTRRRRHDRRRATRG